MRIIRIFIPETCNDVCCNAPSEDDPWAVDQTNPNNLGFKAQPLTQHLEQQQDVDVGMIRVTLTKTSD